MICPRTKAKCGYLAFCDVTGMCLDDEAIRENPLATPADGPGMLSITADEFAAMARDAERYRWLRNYSFDQYKHPIVIEQRGPDDIPRYLGPLCGELLDKKVDAARAERNK